MKTLLSTWGLIVLIAWMGCKDKDCKFPCCDPFVDDNNQIEPLSLNSIVGNKKGELRFFRQGSPMIFARVEGSISSDYDLNLQVTDMIQVAVTNGFQELRSLQGAIGSQGDFWGDLRTDSDTLALRAQNVPDTTTLGQLRIGFGLPVALGIDSLDSIHCILSKN